MSARRGRLERIELSLTPAQAVRLWMQEAHAFASMRAYAGWLVDQPDAAYPLYRLHDLVVPAVRSALKGAPRTEVDGAVRAALREAAFLFCLHQQANARVLQDWRALHLHLALLSVERRSLLTDRALSTKALRERRLRQRSAAEAALLELYALTGALDQLAARYFSGHPLLFEEAAEGLAFCLTTAEMLVEMHNEAIEPAGHADKPGGRTRSAVVSLGKLKEAGARQAERLAGEIADLARAEMLALVGEDRAIVDLLRPYIGQQASTP